MFRLTEHLLNVLTSWDVLILLVVVGCMAAIGLVRWARHSGGDR